KRHSPLPIRNSALTICRVLSFDGTARRGRCDKTQSPREFSAKKRGRARNQAQGRLFGRNGSNAIPCENREQKRESIPLTRKRLNSHRLSCSRVGGARGETVCQLRGLTVQPTRQSAAIDPLQSQEGPAFVRAYLIDLHDVGMPHPRR